MPEFDPTEVSTDVESLVRSTATRHGVDPDLMAGLAKRESGFKQEAISPKGAIGVMQLMPGTAKELDVDPHDLASNIEGGVRYFSQLLKRYDGDVKKAAAAYNAGPGRVDKGGALPKETQDYVSAITGEPASPDTGAVEFSPDEVTVEFDPDQVKVAETPAKSLTSQYVDALQPPLPPDLEKLQGTYNTSRTRFETLRTQIEPRAKASLGVLDNQRKALETGATELDRMEQGIRQIQQGAEASAAAIDAQKSALEQTRAQLESERANLTPDQFESFNAKVADYNTAYSALQSAVDNHNQQFGQPLESAFTSYRQRADELGKLHEAYQAAAKAHDQMVAPLQAAGAELDKHATAFNLAGQAGGIFSVPGMEQLGGLRPGPAGGTPVPQRVSRDLLGTRADQAVFGGNKWLHAVPGGKWFDKFAGETMRSVVSLPTGVGEFISSQSPNSPTVRLVGESIASVGETLENFMQEPSQGTPETFSGDWWASVAGGAIGSMAGFAGAARGTGAVVSRLTRIARLSEKAAARANAAGMLTVGSGLEVLQQAGADAAEAAKKGKTPEEAAEIARKSALFGAPPTFLFNALGLYDPKTASTVKRFLWDAAMEVAQEDSQQIASNYASDRPLDEGLLESTVGALFATGIGKSILDRGGAEPGPSGDAGVAAPPPSGSGGSAGAGQAGPGQAGTGQTGAGPAADPTRARTIETLKNMVDRGGTIHEQRLAQQILKNKFGIDYGPSFEEGATAKPKEEKPAPGAAPKAEAAAPAKPAKGQVYQTPAGTFTVRGVARNGDVIYDLEGAQGKKRSSATAKEFADLIGDTQPFQPEAPGAPAAEQKVEPEQPIAPEAPAEAAAPAAEPGTVELDPEEVKPAEPQATVEESQAPEIIESEEPEKPQRYDYASTQTNLPGEYSKRITGFGSTIPDAALAPDGRESQPHITVKYGLHGEDPAEVEKLLAGEGPVTVKLGKASLFENEDADVLKVDVDSPDLHRLNAKIVAALPNTETYEGGYKPHVTIAYLKPGEGKKYAGKSIPGITGKIITLDRIVFADRSGKQTEFRLGGKREAPAPKPTRAEKAEQKKADQRAAHDAHARAEVERFTDPGDIARPSPDEYQRGLAVLRKIATESHRGERPRINSSEFYYKGDSTGRLFEISPLKGSDTERVIAQFSREGILKPVLEEGTSGYVPEGHTPKPGLQYAVYELDKSKLPGAEADELPELGSPLPFRPKEWIEWTQPGKHARTYQGQITRKTGNSYDVFVPEANGHMLVPATEAPAWNVRKIAKPAPASKPAPAPKPAVDLAEAAGISADDIINAATEALAAKTGRKPTAAAPARQKNALSDAADAARERLRAKMRAAKGEETPAFSRDLSTPKTPAIDKQDLIDLATIGGEHMLNGATSFEEWAPRMKADVGDLVEFVADQSGLTADATMRQVYNFAAAVAKRFDVETEPLPAEKPAKASKPAKGSREEAYAPEPIIAEINHLLAARNLTDKERYLEAMGMYGRASVAYKWLPENTPEAVRKDLAVAIARLWPFAYPQLDENGEMVRDENGKLVSEPLPENARWRKDADAATTTTGSQAEPAPKTKKVSAEDYLSEMVTYGGIEVPRGEMIRDLQSKGATQEQINAYLAGHERSEEGEEPRGTTPENVEELKAQIAEAERADAALMRQLEEANRKDEGDEAKAERKRLRAALRESSERLQALREQLPDKGRQSVSAGRARPPLPDDWKEQTEQHAESMRADLADPNWREHNAERKATMDAAIGIRLALGPIGESTPDIDYWENLIRPLINQSHQRATAQLAPKTITADTPVSEMSPAEFLQYRREQALAVPKGSILAKPLDKWTSKALDGLSKKELEAVLQRHGLPTAGAKPSLIQRILQHGKLRQKFAGKTPEQIEAELTSDQINNVLTQLGGSKFGNKHARAVSLVNTIRKQIGAGESALAKTNHRKAVAAAAKTPAATGQPSTAEAPESTDKLAVYIDALRARYESNTAQSKAKLADAGADLMDEIFDGIEFPAPQPDVKIIDGSYYAGDSDFDLEEQDQSLYIQTRSENASRYANILIARAMLAVPNLPEKSRKAVQDSLATTEASYENYFIEVENAFGTAVMERMRGEIESAIAPKFGVVPSERAQAPAAEGKPAPDTGGFKKIRGDDPLAELDEKRTKENRELEWKYGEPVQYRDTAYRGPGAGKLYPGRVVGTHEWFVLIELDNGNNGRGAGARVRDFAPSHPGVFEKAGIDREGRGPLHGAPVMMIPGSWVVEYGVRNGKEGKYWPPQEGTKPEAEAPVTTRKGSKVPVGPIKAKQQDLSFVAAEPVREGDDLRIEYTKPDGSRLATMVGRVTDKNFNVSNYYNNYEYVEVIDRHFQEVMRVARAGLLEQPTAAASDEQAVQTALRGIETRDSVAVPVADLRSKAELPKDRFDRAVLDLYRQGAVMLHRHDAPGLISEEQRNELVTDGEGRYYVGISWPERQDTEPAAVDLQTELERNRERIKELSEEHEKALHRALDSGKVTTPADLDKVEELAAIERERTRLSRRNYAIRDEILLREARAVKVPADKWDALVEDLTDASKHLPLDKDQSIERTIRPDLDTPEARGLYVRAYDQGLLKLRERRHFTFLPEFVITADPRPETIGKLIDQYRRWSHKRKNLLSETLESLNSLKTDHPDWTKKIDRARRDHASNVRWERQYRRLSQKWEDEYRRITGTEYESDVPRPANPREAKPESQKSLPTLARDGRVMTYFTGSSRPEIREAAKGRNDIGLVVTPQHPEYLDHIGDYSLIMVDNGAFSKEGFQPAKFRALLDRIAATPGAREKVAFVVAPDVVRRTPDGDAIGDAAATLKLFPRWAKEIRDRGLPVALAAQDGLESRTEQIPWDQLDVLFVAGSTDWKTGEKFLLTNTPEEKGWHDIWIEAKRRGVPVHAGRVNSFERMDSVQRRTFASSADGTFVAHGPAKNTPQVVSWLDAMNKHGLPLELAGKPSARDTRTVAETPQSALPLNVPLDQLSKIEANAYDPQKLENARQAETPEDFPPIDLSWNKALGLNGRLMIDDGNHRLAVAREKGWPYIKARISGDVPADVLEGLRGPATDELDADILDAAGSALDEAMAKTPATEPEARPFLTPDNAPDIRRALHEVQADLAQARDLAELLAYEAEDEEPHRDDPAWDKLEALGDKYGLTFTFDREKARQFAIHELGFDADETIPAYVYDEEKIRQSWDQNRGLVKTLPEAISNWRDWLEEKLATGEEGGLFKAQRELPVKPVPPPKAKSEPQAPSASPIESEPTAPLASNDTEAQPAPEAAAKPDTVNPISIPAADGLTWAERIVLIATRSLKSSYGGKSNFRFRESYDRTGITQLEWNAAKQALIARKLLNAAGAITDAGKDAIKAIPHTGSDLVNLAPAGFKSGWNGTGARRAEQAREYVKQQSIATRDYALAYFRYLIGHEANEPDAVKLTDAERAETVRQDLLRIFAPGREMPAAPQTPAASPVGTEQIAVTGDTYRHRVQLRSLGGKWNKEAQAWIFPASEANRVGAISPKLVIGPHGEPALPEPPATAAPATPAADGRTTPALGTPEREKLESDYKKAQETQEANWDSIREAEKEVRNAKWGSKKKEAAERRLEKFREVERKISAIAEPLRQKSYMAGLEDLAQSEDRIAQVAASQKIVAVTDEERRKAGGAPLSQKEYKAINDARDAALETIRAELRKIAPGLDADPQYESTAKEIAALTADENVEAVNSAIRDLAEEMLQYPHRSEETEKALTGRLHATRVKTYKRKAEAILEAEEKRYQEATGSVGVSLQFSDARRSINEAYELEQIDRAVANAKAATENAIEAKIAADKDRAEARKLLSERVRPLAELPVPKMNEKVDKDHVWDGNVIVGANFVSDGHAMIYTSAITDFKRVKTLQKMADGQSYPEDAAKEKVWDKLIAGATQPLTEVGTVEVSAGYIAPTDVAIYTLPDGTIVPLSSKRVRFIQSLIGAAELRGSAPVKSLTSGKMLNQGVAFYQGGKPIAVLMPFGKAPDIDLAVARRAVRGEASAKAPEMANDVPAGELTGEELIETAQAVMDSLQDELRAIEQQSKPIGQHLAVFLKDAQKFLDIHGPTLEQSAPLAWGKLRDVVRGAEDRLEKLKAEKSTPAHWDDARKAVEAKFPRGQRVMFHSEGGSRQFGRVERIDDHGSQKPRFTLAVKDNGVNRHVNADLAQRAWERGEKVTYTDSDGDTFYASVWNGVQDDEGRVVVKIGDARQTYRPKADLVKRSDHTEDRLVTASEKAKAAAANFKEGDRVQWTNPRGQFFSGRVTFVYPSTGELKVETDQEITIVPGLPTSHSTTVNAAKVEKIETDAGKIQPAEVASVKAGNKNKFGQTHWTITFTDGKHPQGYDSSSRQDAIDFAIRNRMYIESNIARRRAAAAMQISEIQAITDKDQLRELRSQLIEAKDSPDLSEEERENARRNQNVLSAWLQRLNDEPAQIEPEPAENAAEDELDADILDAAGAAVDAAMEKAPEAPAGPKSFKYQLKIHGEGDKWHDVSVRFRTREEAEKAGLAKFTAWTMADDHRVVESDDEPNYRWDDEEHTIKAIEAPVPAPEKPAGLSLAERAILENLDIYKPTRLPALAAYVKHDVPGFSEADLQVALTELSNRDLVSYGVDLDAEPAVTRNQAGTEALKEARRAERKEGTTYAPKPSTPKERRAAELARQREFYTPGNVITGYGNSIDKVLAYNEKPNGDFTVTVQASKEDGTPEPNERPRTHSTPPDKHGRILSRANAAAEDPLVKADREALARMRERRYKPQYQREPGDLPPAKIDKQDLIDLTTMGAKRMVIDGITGYQAWSDRMMADIGDLISDIADETRQSSEDVLRTIHRYASAVAMKRGVTPEAAPAAEPKPAYYVERYQWMRSRALGQDLGARYEIRKLTEDAFRQYRRHFPPGTIEDFQRGNPAATHYSVVDHRYGEGWEWQGAGPVKMLRPQPDDPRKVKRVDSFDSPEARAQSESAEEDLRPEGKAGEPIADSKLIPEADKLIKSFRGIINAIANHKGDPDVIANNTALMAHVKAVTGRSVADGGIDTKQVYDLLETAFNQEIAQTREFMDLMGKGQSVEYAVKHLRYILSHLPTQAIRSEEMVQYQQFSTPPTEALIAARVLAPTPQDIVMEPSAGTGGLASFAKAAGAHVLVNEINPRRAELLRRSGYADLLRVDGEQIDNLYDDLWGVHYPDPTAVLMNPPFSAAGERGTSNSNDVGYRHVMQALRRLQEGGRLVAILGGGNENPAARAGEGASLTAPTAQKFWQQVRDIATVRANVRIAGKEYAKYGTTFATRIVVIDKVPAKPGIPQSPVTGDFDTLEEAWNALKDIARDRQPLADLGTGAKGSGSGSGRPGNAGGVREPGGQPGASVRGESGTGSGDATGGRSGAGDANSTRNEPRVQPGDGAPGDRTGGSRDADGTSADPNPPVAQDQAVHTGEEIGDYVAYKPTAIPAEWGAQPHNAVIVETQTMASVPEPPLTIKPNVPQEIITTGELSDIQLATIAHTLQAHERFTQDGRRLAFFNGDGTGVGKGRMNAGTAVHYWRTNPAGKRKTIWISFNEELAEAARDDLDNVGGKQIPIYSLEKVKPGKQLPFKDGVLFVPYSKIAAQQVTKADGSKFAKGASKAERASGQKVMRRLQQIIDWAGEEPLIIFDEAHKAKNATATQEQITDQRKATKKPTLTGLAAIELQNKIPKARVLYSSATGFSDVSNMAYANRLDAWGPGTAFKDFQDFRQQIDQGGIGIMEMVARDLKAQGKYLSRFISYQGVRFDETTHEITPEQHQMLDRAGEAWRTVVKYFRAAAAETTGNTNDPLARGKVLATAMSQLWGAELRFYRSLYTAMKIPTLIKIIDEAVTPTKEHPEGKSVVISVMETGQAQQDREIERLSKSGEDDLEGADVSPVASLIDMVDKRFPTIEYETVKDEHGQDITRVRMEKVLVNGVEVERPAQNKQALREKAKLLADLEKLRGEFPDSALDQIINKYGATNVAEMTKRSERLIRNSETGKREIQSRGSDLTKTNLSEMAAFQNGDKTIALISNAASTGISLHSSIRANNQRQRVHVMLQLKWSADMVMQDLGRTHRTAQRIPPEYILLSLNVEGEKRFAATVARRLEQLGALSRGERKAGGGATDFSRYNFESRYGRFAVDQVIERLYFGGDRFGYLTNERMEEYPALTDGRAVLTLMGLYDPQAEHDKEDETSPDVPVNRFFNRLMILPIKMQNQLFRAFAATMEHNIESSKRLGMFDAGAEMIRAVNLKQDGPPLVVYQDPTTGAQAVFYRLEARNHRYRYSWQARQNDDRVFRDRLLRVRASGRLLAVERVGSRETDPDTGRQRARLTAYGASGTALRFWEDEWDDDDSSSKYETVPADAKAKAEWDRQYEAAGEWITHFENLITGSVLPIWAKIQEKEGSGKSERGKPVKVKIAKLDNGARLIGAHIEPHRVREVLKALGHAPVVKPESVMRGVLGGKKFNLMQGATLKRAKVSGENRIELEGAVHFQRLFGQWGLYTESVGNKPRWFIPTGERGLGVLTRVLKELPVRGEDEEESPAYSREMSLFDGVEPEPIEVTHKPGIALVNQAGMRALAGVWNESGRIRGMRLTQKQVAKAVDALRSTAPELARAIAKAGAKGGPVIVVDRDQKLSEIVKALRHEKFHLATDQLKGHLGGRENAVLAHPLAAEAVTRLRASGYRSREIAVEIGAHLAAGQYEQLGLTAAQAQELFVHYITVLDRQHGEESVEQVVTNLAPMMREAVRAERSRRRQAGNVPGGRRDSGAAYQGQFDEGTEGVPGGRQGSPGESSRRDLRHRESPDYAREARQIDPDERRVRESVLTKLNADPEHYLAEYTRQFGNLLNADDAATLFPEYNQDRAKYRVAVHPAATWIRDELFRRALEREEPDIVFTAGGNAAGKSTAIRATGADREAAAVFDSTLSNPEHARRLVDQALDAGKRITIVYVARPLEEIFPSMLERADREGRVVTINQLVNSHRGAAETVRALWDEFEQDSRFRFRFVDNSGETPHLSTIELAAPEDYTESRNRLYELLDAERKAGRITEATYHRVGGRTQPLRGPDRGPGSGGTSQSGSGEEGAQSPTRRVIEFLKDETGTSNAAATLRTIRNRVRGVIFGQGPRGNYSGLGAFKDITVREASQLERASKTAYGAFRTAAGSRGQSSVLMRTVAPKVKEALKGSGIPYETFRAALIESRLRGIRDRYLDLAVQVLDYQTEAEFVKAYNNGLGGLMAAIEGRGGLEDELKQDADAMLANGDLDSLREFLVENFLAAHRRVATMDPAFQPFGGFERVIANPGFQRALMVYKELLEKPMAENHDSNEGVFSDALGPLDTYYPLIPVTEEDEHRAMQGRNTAYKKPKNMASQFATGLADEYDPDLQVFGEHLANAIRANNKAAFLDILERTGIVRKLGRGEAPPTMDVPDEHGGPARKVKVHLYQGVPYAASVVTVGEDRIISVEGQSTFVPAQRLLIPDWARKELHPFLEAKNMEQVPGRITRFISMVNSFSLQGPLDFVFHATNVLGTLVFRTPFAGAGILSKTIGNTPATKIFTAILNTLRQDVKSDEALKKLYHMAKLGLVPSRYGIETYSKQIAEETGAELTPRWKMGPLLYGPHGLDIRTRLLLYDIAHDINPNVTDRELTTFIRQMGEYNRELEGRIERFMKDKGLAPFFTAGTTMYRNSIAAWLGGGAMPKAAPWTGPLGGLEPLLPRDKALWMARLLGGTAIGLLALWAVLHRLMRDKWPWEDPTSRLLQIAVPQEFRRSPLGRALYGSDLSREGMIDLGFFNPMVTRGGRSLGLAGAYNTWILDGSGGQMMEAAQKDMLNSFAHPFTSGPLIKAGSIGIFGVDPYIVAIRDRRTGRFGPQFMPAIAKAPPGIPTLGARLGEAFLNTNSFYQGIGAALFGLGHEAEREKDQGERWLRTITDLGLPRLVGRTYNPWRTRESMRQERRAAQGGGSPFANPFRP